jgi:hypothetical protein
VNTSIKAVLARQQPMRWIYRITCWLRLCLLNAISVWIKDLAKWIVVLMYIYKYYRQQTKMYLFYEEKKCIDENLSDDIRILDAFWVLFPNK